MKIMKKTNLFYFSLFLVMFFLTTNSVLSQTIAPASGALTNGTTNSSYSVTLTGTATNNGWTCTLSVSSGSLPTGLTFSQTSGAGTASATISGTPTVSGTFNFSIFFNCVNGGGQSQQSVTNNYSIRIQTPTAASVFITGRVIDNFGKGISRAKVNLLNTSTGESYIANTNPFGYFRFSELNAEGFYILEIRHKRYNFDILTLSPKEDINDLLISPN